MAGGKKKAKSAKPVRRAASKAGKGKGKGKGGNTGDGDCNLPDVCSYLTELSSYLATVDTWLKDVTQAVKRLEKIIHCGDTTEKGPAYSVFADCGGGGGKNPPPPPPAYP